MTHDELREVASEAVRKALIQPMCCMQGSGCEFPPCHCSTVAADAVLAAVWEALMEPDAGMKKAAEDNFMDQYGTSRWEDAKDVAEDVDVADMLRRAFAASPLRPAASAEGVG